MCFVFRALLLGWKLLVLMVILITTTQRLEVESFSISCLSFLLQAYNDTLHLPHLSESSWEKPADFPSNVASGSEPTKEEECPEEPATPQPESLSGGEESSNGAPPSQEAEPPEEASQQPKVPKISFRVRVNETYISACQDYVEKFSALSFVLVFRKGKPKPSLWNRRRRIKRVTTLLKKTPKRQKKRKWSKA